MMQYPVAIHDELPQTGSKLINRTSRAGTDIFVGGTQIKDCCIVDLGLILANNPYRKITIWPGLPGVQTESLPYEEIGFPHVIHYCIQDHDQLIHRLLVYVNGNQ